MKHPHPYITLWHSDILLRWGWRILCITEPLMIKLFCSYLAYLRPPSYEPITMLLGSSITYIFNNSAGTTFFKCYNQYTYLSSHYILVTAKLVDNLEYNCTKTILKIHWFFIYFPLWDTGPQRGTLSGFFVVFFAALKLHTVVSFLEFNSSENWPRYFLALGLLVMPDVPTVI